MPVTEIPAVSERPTLTIPEAGAILGMKRSAAYRGVNDGRIPAVYVTAATMRVPTASLRTMLGLPIDGPAITLSKSGGE